MLLACRVELADWHDHAALRARLIAGVAASASQGRATDMVPAFDFLALCDDPALQLTAARGWSASEVAGIAPLAPRPRRASRKLRLGFVSSDFGNHPVGRLVIALLERLDREHFEVIAFVTTAETRDGSACARSAPSTSSRSSTEAIPPGARRPSRPRRSTCCST